MSDPVWHAAVWSAPVRRRSRRVAVLTALLVPLIATSLTPANADTGLKTGYTTGQDTVVTSVVAATTTTQPVASATAPVVPVPVLAAAPRATAVRIVRLAFGLRVIAEARRHFGAPYQWGATGPTRFDCSGFTRYVFRKFGKRLPRVAAAQYAATRHISIRAKRIGDLIFRYNSGGIFHVGIYAGNGRMIAATQTGDVVRLERIRGRYKVGRVR